MLTLAYWLIAIGTITLAVHGLTFVNETHRDIKRGHVPTTLELLINWSITGAIIAIALGVVIVLAQ